MHLTSNGIKADPSKVEAIKNKAQPRDVKELRSFLGLSNYCSKFIQNYSTLTAPLRELTVKNTKFEWKPVHKKAFEAIKQAIQKDALCTITTQSKELCSQLMQAQLAWGNFIKCRHTR